MCTVAEAWTHLTARWVEMEQLAYLKGALGWDQQTYMPPGGGASRGEHMAFLSKQLHERLCDPRMGEWLHTLREGGATLTDRQRAGVNKLLRRHERERAIPEALVGRLARLQSGGFAAWLAARECGDFARLEPVLTELVAAVRERASAMDSAPPYATMLDEYDPGVDPDSVADMFERLRVGIAPLLDGVRGAPRIPPLDGSLAEAGQRHVARVIAARLGFDLHRGRIDIAPHPFTATVGADDVRITIRVAEDDLFEMLSTTTHETGHALYEQGLPRGEPGVSEPASMGMHESQSRFWENLIGRSRPFLGWLRGPLRESFGHAPDLDTLHRAANRVEPGFIRIKADEVTYNLHVGVRFDLERQLFAEHAPLAVRDLPEAWNAAFERDLGLVVDHPARGVLQDVHWASAAFGYFPSYTLGNVYAASFLRRIEQERPDMWADAERGEFGEVLTWLRDRVHRHGAAMESPALLQHVCAGEGAPCDPVEDFLDHLWHRHGALYGLARPVDAALPEPVT